MKKALICVFLVALVFVLFVCISRNHTHTYEYIGNVKNHYKQYTCGCPTFKIPEAHYDNDANNECDACSRFTGTRISGLAMGTYYLPYESTSERVSMTFLEDLRCVCASSNPEKDPYICNYRIKDGKVYLDTDFSQKYKCVFTITDNALLYDKELSKSWGLWGSQMLRGPVIYCLPGISQSEILSAAVMARDGLESPPVIEKIYGKYDLTLAIGTYDMYAFKVAGSEAAACWSDKILGTDYTFTYADSGEILIYVWGRLLSLNQALDEGYITTEIVAELNENHHDCAIVHSYDEGVITQIPGGGEEILYTCHICGATKTAPLPEDFSFAFTWSFDGYYNSKTGLLRNGYNYTLDTECKTSLVLDHNALMNIYRILYNAGFLEIREDFRASDRSPEPSYDIKIHYEVDGEIVDLTIKGATSLSYSEWVINSAFCFAYNQVIEEFIKSSEEYKAMPPNQNLYD